LLAGNKILSAGGTALDAATVAVTVLEDCPLFNAGRGAVFNVVGEHEMEASVTLSEPPNDIKEGLIDKVRRGVGVTLLKHVRHPVLLAKELYLDPVACPHALVSGSDAERIAKDKGLELKDPKWFDTE